MLPCADGHVFAAGLPDKLTEAENPPDSVKADIRNSLRYLLIAKQIPTHCLLLLSIETETLLDSVKFKKCLHLIIPTILKYRNFLYIESICF